MNKMTLAIASAAFCLAQGAIAAPVQNKLAAPTPGQTNGTGGSCSNSIVLDCSFESGTPSSGWSEASTNFGTPICDEAGCGTGGAPIGPNSGEFWTWFGGISDFEEGSVSQSVIIPAAATGTLTFYYMAPACSGDAADFVEVTMDGTQLWSSTGADATYCNIDTAYTQISVDVSAYVDGASHALAFHSIVGGGAPTGVGATPDGKGTTTNFWVDDVDLVVSGTPGGGGGPVGDAVELPSLGTSAMIGLGALLAMFGFAGVRRRRMD